MRDYHQYPRANFMFLQFLITRKTISFRS